MKQPILKTISPTLALCAAGALALFPLANRATAAMNHPSARQDSGQHDTTGVRVTRASDYIGTDVIAADHHKVGDIVDYVFNLDRAPHLAYVLVMTGGFLQYGGDVRAVPAGAITMQGDTAHIGISSADYWSEPVISGERARYLSNGNHTDRINQLFHASGSDRTQGRLIAFSQLANGDSFSPEGMHLGFIVDAWVSLDLNRAPFLEIDPAYWRFRTNPPFQRYAVPMTKLREHRGSSHFTLDLEPNDFANAKAVSDARSVKLLSVGPNDDTVLLVQMSPLGSHRGQSPNEPGQNGRDRTAQSSRSSADVSSVQPAIDGNAYPTVRALTGQHVRSSDDQDLGTLKDFMIDANSGNIVYAVVSSGGFMGAYDRLRVVPIHALRHSADQGAFTVQISSDRFKQLPKVNEEDFEADHLAVDDSDRQQLDQAFAQSDNSDHSMMKMADNHSLLMRATEIRGKSVHCGNAKAGDIENVVVDLSECSAQALLDPNSDFTGSDQKLLVPVSQLKISNRQADRFTTSIARSDFQLAASNNAQAMN
ncbi:MAG TPA: PRC-barrel domain-containing protein [Opitutus sp.]|nr:PRC-barrel domain-containing protein [Opitutus sp.]